MTLYGDHKCLFGRCSGYCLWYLQQAKYFTSSCSSSQCILLGSHLMMPFDYQHQAGEANARNWKAIIRYLDQPFSHFLENYVNADGKNCCLFVNMPTGLPPFKPTDRLQANSTFWLTYHPSSVGLMGFTKHLSTVSFSHMWNKVWPLLILLNYQISFSQLLSYTLCREPLIPIASVIL